MKITITLLSLMLSTGLLTAQSTCASAPVIDTGNYLVPSVNGSEVPSPVCASGGDNADHGIWYRYGNVEDLTLTVSTDLEENEGIDTRVHIYSGECGNLSCLGGDDDSGSGFLSILTVQVEAGEAYYIAFDDNWTDQGFVFELIENEPIEQMVSFGIQTINLQGSGICIVDMDGDHLDDVVGVSGNQINVHRQQAGGTFQSNVYATPEADHNPSWSLAAGDLDANGKTDLLYGGGSGVTFMFASDDGTTFTESSGPEYVFSQRSNMVDINNDGILDAFVCHDVAPNVYFISDGEGNMTFNQGGIGDTPDGGNYGSVWIDYDNDHDIDMFIAKCRGGNSPANINQMHRNNGDGTFTEVAEELNLADNVQTWSSAWADFDNDGDMDVLIGASSFTNGGHKLMRNDGDTFTDVTEGSGYDLLTATGIENAPADFNNDGYVDVYGAGNVIMFNTGNLTFVPSVAPFGNGPMGDVNNDGFVDVQNGGTLFLNQGNEHNYIKVTTVGTASNINGIGARIEVHSALGTQIRDVRSGEGFRYMSSLNAHFGLGEDTEIDMIVVYWPSGIVDYIMEPEVNQHLVIVEGSEPLSVDDIAEADIRIFPNPASDILTIQSSGQRSFDLVRVLDISGKVVLQSSYRKGELDVQNLAPGAYVLELRNTQGHLGHKRFLKN
ncbi:MAG: FG-GAP-like repeat-containing protein [Bacteroidetes bacterium]|nr:FG-GAP-like repeat-containing protein [Bacteroidota bacterium]